MRELGLVWDKESLDGYPANPAKLLEGGKMEFPGLKMKQDRKDVSAYLRSLAP